MSRLSIDSDALFYVIWKSILTEVAKLGGQHDCTVSFPGKGDCTFTVTIKDNSMRLFQPKKVKKAIKHRGINSAKSHSRKEAGNERLKRG